MIEATIRALCCSAVDLGLVPERLNLSDSVPSRLLVKFRLVCLEDLYQLSNRTMGDAGTMGTTGAPNTTTAAAETPLEPDTMPEKPTAPTAQVIAPSSDMSCGD